MSYPNMSYCMFENTLEAMRQLVESMEEDETSILSEMSKSERRAFDSLYTEANAFMKKAEMLVEREESLVNDQDP